MVGSYSPLLRYAYIYNRYNKKLRCYMCYRCIIIAKSTNLRRELVGRASRSQETPVDSHDDKHLTSLE